MIWREHASVHDTVDRSRQSATTAGHCGFRRSARIWRRGRGCTGSFDPATFLRAQITMPPVTGRPEVSDVSTVSTPQRSERLLLELAQIVTARLILSLSRAVRSAGSCQFRAGAGNPVRRKPGL